MSYFDDNEDYLTGLTLPVRVKIPKLFLERKQLNITILNISPTPATTKSGKPYEVLDIAYKNNTFQGKVEGKKLMPFGPNAPAFAALKGAGPGQSFEITVNKNQQGYNDWTAAAPSAGYVPISGAAGNAGLPAATPAQTRQNTYETPEERAKKQVYIIKQSSLSAAIATLSPGAKSALKPDEVTALAQHYTDFVLGNDKPAGQESATGFDVMSDDIPY